MSCSARSPGSGSGSARARAHAKAAEAEAGARAGQGRRRGRREAHERVEAVEGDSRVERSARKSEPAMPSSWNGCARPTRPLSRGLWVLRTRRQWRGRRRRWRRPPLRVEIEDELVHVGSGVCEAQREQVRRTQAGGRHPPPPARLPEEGRGCHDDCKARGEQHANGLLRAAICDLAHECGQPRVCNLFGASICGSWSRQQERRAGPPLYTPKPEGVKRGHDTKQLPQLGCCKRAQQHRRRPAASAAPLGRGIVARAHAPAPPRVRSRWRGPLAPVPGQPSTQSAQSQAIHDATSAATASSAGLCGVWALPGRRTPHDEQIAPRRAVLTPHAAAAVQPVSEGGGTADCQRTAAAPCAVAPPEQRSGAGRGCGPHPEYDPANSRAASLLYPDRTMYREDARAVRLVGGGGSTAPCAAGDAMLCAPPDGGCTAPQPLQSAAPPLAPSHVDGQRPQALDAERDEEVVAALRMQVAALTALLENGVCVPLLVGAAHEVAEGGGAAHRAAEAPSAAPLPPQPRRCSAVV